MFKRGYILRGRVDSGMASYSLKGGTFWEGRVDFGIKRHFTVTYSRKKGGVDPRMEW